MLVQERSDGLGLITQHDHAALSGELAHAWRGVRGEGALPHRLVWAVTMHDLAWIEQDAWGWWSQDQGRLASFHDVPIAERVALYGRGLDALEAIHPYVATLVSLHYTSFTSSPAQGVFLDAEADRRERLGRELGEEGEPEALAAALRWLKCFDRLSLFICLTSPALEPGNAPPWLGAESAGLAGDGTRLGLRWRDGATLELDPFPFGPAPLEVRVPLRRVAERRFAGPGAMSAALASAARGWWTVRLVGASHEEG